MTGYDSLAARPRDEANKITALDAAMLAIPFFANVAGGPWGHGVMDRALPIGHPRPRFLQQMPPKIITLAPLIIELLGSASGCSLALAKETADLTAELTRLELLVPTAASTGTNQVLRLRGAEARQQLLVTASFSTGALRDYTREVRYETLPAGVIQVSKTGRVTPLAEGTATITAKSSDGLTATLAVT